MTRKLWIFGIVGVLGLSVAVAGVGHLRTAAACDENTKTASTTTHSCCAKNGTASASVDAKQVHNSMIKSAVVAPGAATIVNAAAFGGMVAGSKADCDWCPEMSASACATKMSASGCQAMMQTAGTMAASGCPHAASATAASLGNQPAAATVAAGDDEKASGGCCETKSANTAANEEKCSAMKTASLKGKVDEMPYRENKRVVLAGSYACGHCNLEMTEDCSPMVKTADGKVYPLLKNSLASELRSAEGKSLQLSGTVKKIDGVKYLDVKSYKII